MAKHDSATKKRNKFTLSRPPIGYEYLIGPVVDYEKFLILREEKMELDARLKALEREVKRTRLKERLKESPFYPPILCDYNYNSLVSQESNGVIVPHPRHEGVFMLERTQLFTINMVPGEAVYGETLHSVKNEDGSEVEYRLWNPSASNLAAAILKGVADIYIKPGTKVLYLGADSYTTVSHLSDIVGTSGMLYAVTSSPCPHLENMKTKRVNVVPIVGDVMHPTEYIKDIEPVDVILSEFSVSCSGHMMDLNASSLKVGGHFVLLIKAIYLRSDNPFNFPGYTIAREFRILRENQFYPSEQVNLKTGHVYVMGAYKSDSNNLKLSATKKRKHGDISRPPIRAEYFDGPGDYEQFLSLRQEAMENNARRVKALEREEKRTRLKESPFYPIRYDYNYNSLAYRESNGVIVPHPRHEGVFMLDSKQLFTINMVPGEAVYGETLHSVQNEDGSEVEYRLWNPSASNLAAAILEGVADIYIKPGTKVLYLGADSYTTVSHLSDIVGTSGMVYAVTSSPCPHLENMKTKRVNVVPIVGDVMHPTEYIKDIEPVDGILSEFSMSCSGHMMDLNASSLKVGGHFVLLIKAIYLRSDNPFNFPGYTIAREFRILRENQFYPSEQVNLKTGHVYVMGAYKSDSAV